MRKLFLLLLLLSLISSPILGDDTGELVPTTVQDGTNWTNWVVDSIDTSDDDRTTYAAATQDVAGATGFGVDITSTGIDSIIVITEGYGTGGGPTDQRIEVQLLIAGVGTGDWVAIQFGKNPGNEADQISVGITDALWNTGATESDVEHAQFGVQYRDINTTIDLFAIDYVRVRVVYTSGAVDVYSGKFPRGIARGIGR